ncbi:NAD(P)H-dependent flavin oxidoreductase [Actinokineospora bangkokensis]|uniref:2-nitropropane dioxygenase n=1 Tax=Actinokineospora bangkokensis TaxID=1193682 RepID=A0A1Q9LS41_9PSEU|nr:nitronate monooxygenase [Actinokineospora bangkokensis]OLR94839.1 2-nitropropane dioxygenase [Actinokineospora bangkokensis]
MTAAWWRRLGLAAPLAQAPIGSASTPALVAAVAEAGALGVLAASWTAPSGLARHLLEVGRRTDRAFAVNLVLRWPQHDRLAIALDSGVRVISTSWGDPAPYRAAITAAGALHLHMVGDAEEARAAVDSGVDVVVAQGWEAGGHVRGTTSTLALVPEVVGRVAPVPVLAAGGIADARGIRAALALGAQGAWVGTRYLLAQESAAHPVYRSALIAASGSDTVHTTAFRDGWPDAPHRVLRNGTLTRWEAAGSPSPGDRPGEGEVIAQHPELGAEVRYRDQVPVDGHTGDVAEMALYAGQGVGLLTGTEPAAAITAELLGAFPDPGKSTSHDVLS